MSKPVAVLISDVHFNLSTLELASSAMKMAQNRAVELNVPLVVAGDLTDHKAIIRGEVANRLIEIFNCDSAPKTYVITGNHDMLNEKGSAHALNFLAPYVSVVSRPVSVHGIGQLLPYFNDSDALKAVLAEIPPGSTIIMHQGVQTAYLGHYVQDKTSLPKEAFADFRVISGHYHRAQDIVCGRPRKGAVGLFSYIGNPYSLSFGEASDGPKGFQILGDDGLLTQVPTNLRKHVKLSNGTQEPLLGANTKINPGDLVWIQVTAPASELASINKKELGLRLGIGSNYRLDLIKTDVEAPKATTEAQSEAELLDALIDALPETDAQKKTLKSLWRDL